MFKKIRSYLAQLLFQVRALNRGIRLLNKTILDRQETHITVEMLRLQMEVKSLQKELATYKNAYEKLNEAFNKPSDVPPLKEDYHAPIVEQVDEVIPVPEPEPEPEPQSEPQPEPQPGLTSEEKRAAIAERRMMFQRQEGESPLDQL